MRKGETIGHNRGEGRHGVARAVLFLNFLGRYQFSLPSGARDGELRDLRDPNAGREEELRPPVVGA